MDHYTQGRFTRQAHKGIPEGHFEEEQGLSGFFGPVSHLIRSKPSTRWTDIDGPLRPHMYDLAQTKQSSGRQRLLYNEQTTIAMEFHTAVETDQLQAYRNADGDLLFFCHAGSGHFLSEYGTIPYNKGQYVVIPKCLTYAIAPREKTSFFVVENRNSHYQQPDRGLVGRHAIYDPNAITKPDLEAQVDLLKKVGSIKKISVKRGDEWTHFSYADCIFSDVVGWKGDLYPFALHTDHMMPLLSHRAHLPPSAHTTFVARDFVICTFLPRPLESDEDALKVPFYHQNIDYDEVLFYHDGDFFSRANLHPGMMSFHPAGFPHGPHPKAIEKVKGQTHTNEYAVMVDTRWPLKMDPFLNQVEVADYWKSWQG